MLYRLVNMNVQINGGMFILLALGILLMPLQWLVAAILAAVIHELCHFIMIRICGGNVPSISINAFGAQMESEISGTKKELLCALAGPVGGLLLLPLSSIFPRLVFCAACHSIYNLLPIFPLDGGRILHCAAFMLLPPPVGRKVCKWTERFCMTVLFLMAVYGTFKLKLGWMPVILAIFSYLRMKSVKTPCKAGL